MCLSRAPPPPAWRGVGGLIPKWRKCTEHIRFSRCFLKLRTNQLFWGWMRWLLYRIWCFSMIFGRFSTLPPWGVSVYIYPRTGPCVSKMFQFWETFANTPKNRWGFLDWFSASGGPQGTKFRARWALFADCYKWSFSNDRTYMG